MFFTLNCELQKTPHNKTSFGYFTANIIRLFWEFLEFVKFLFDTKINFDVKYD